MNTKLRIFILLVLDALCIASMAAEWATELYIKDGFYVIGLYLGDLTVILAAILMFFLPVAHIVSGSFPRFGLIAGASCLSTLIVIELLAFIVPNITMPHGFHGPRNFTNWYYVSVALYVVQLVFLLLSAKKSPAKNSKEAA